MESRTYWEDLERDLADPDFLREFVIESVRIATIDEVVNALDDARIAAGLSKAEVARVLQVEPATVRRLFSSQRANPTLGTLAEVATVLGLRVTLEPLPASERQVVTASLWERRTRNPRRLARELRRMRTRRREVVTV